MDFDGAVRRLALEGAAGARRLADLHDLGRVHGAVEAGGLMALAGGDAGAAGAGDGAGAGAGAGGDGHPAADVAALGRLLLVALGPADPFTELRRALAARELAGWRARLPDRPDRFREPEDRLRRVARQAAAAAPGTGPTAGEVADRLDAVARAAGRAGPRSGGVPGAAAVLGPGTGREPLRSRTQNAGAPVHRRGAGATGGPGLRRRRLVAAGGAAALVGGGVAALAVLGVTGPSAATGDGPRPGALPARTGTTGTAAPSGLTVTSGTTVAPAGAGTGATGTARHGEPVGTEGPGASSGRVWPPPEPHPAAGRAGCDPVPAGPAADVDGDGCPEALAVEGVVVTAGDRRWAVGSEGDTVLLGDWDCDGHHTPAVLEAGGRRLYVFDGWAAAGGTQPGRPVPVPAGTVGLEPRGCGHAAVRLADGTTGVVATGTGP